MSDGDSFTEVTSQNYFQRLGGSIIGVLFGLLLVPGAIVLLWWNEGRVVHALDALAAGEKQLVEISPSTVDATAEGKLVHLTGPLTVKAGARDPVFGVSQPDLVRLKRDVEMYQWKEETHEESHTEVGGTKTTVKTYTYVKDWSSGHIDSSHFKHPEGHQNPGMSVANGTFNGQDLKLGAYKVAPPLLAEIDAFTPLTPSEPGPVPDGWQRGDAGFRKSANESGPTIGDLKVSFEGISAQTYSVVAALASGSLTEFHGQNDYDIVLAKPGVASASELFQAKAAEERLITWILRGVGFVLMLVGFLLIAQPAAMLFAFLPFLEGIASAGTFLIAITLTIPITLVVIAIAWIAHRPLIGGGLLVAALVLLLLFRKMHPKPAPRIAPA
jgi:hypothetical protein